MSGLELNKIAASILLAGLIAMISANITDILYKPNLKPTKSGFAIAVQDGATEGGVSEAPKVISFDIKALLEKANAAKGAEISKKCSACHSLEQNGPNRVGPHLWGIVGREKASIADYSYSTAFKEQKGKWSYDDLFHYLYDPKGSIPGNKMSFFGIKKPEDLADLVAYLRTLSSSPEPLP
jgi:cytochrome c